jgi:monothiol glutaredoxin
MANHEPESGGLMSETTSNPTTAGNPMRDAIASAISDNPVILFMKGTPEAPACGFSARTVAILEAVDQPFAAVNILPDPAIRQELSGLSGWPTIPQLFVGGELVGGCDIVMDMYETGELHELFGKPKPVAAETPAAEAQSAPLQIDNLL